MNRRTGITNIEILVGVLVALAVAVAIIALVKLDVTGEKGSGLGKEFIYDTKDLGKIDPNLILYEQVAKAISTGFTNSRGIALDSQGFIYVAGDKAIRLLDKNGNLLNEINLDDTPRCLAVADDGRVYLGMKDHVEVYEGAYPSEGKRLGIWGALGDDAFLTSIAVYKNDVFVADAGNRIVLRYDTTGKLINRIGAKDKDRNIPGFVIPSPYLDLAIGRDGLLRVIDTGRHRIEAYTFEGDLEFWWGKFSNVDVKGFSGCCNPVNFAILQGSSSAGTDDSFVTSEKSLTRIKIYDAEGAFVGVVAGPEQLTGGAWHICNIPAQCQKGGFDVAVDAEGRIFVLDTIKNVVRIFTRIKRG